MPDGTAAVLAAVVPVGVLLLAGALLAVLGAGELAWLDDATSMISMSSS